MMRFRRAIVALAVLAITPVAIATPTPRPDANRTGLDKDLIYFVMPDRYRDGDPTNNGGDGFDPTSIAHFHGGDLKGLTGNCSDDDGLARIKRLGFTAIWMTPLVVQQAANSGGAGYHGYWGVDFTKVDPHLGSNEDLLRLSQCAKKLGLKLILDVVTNHTGDVIQYQGREAYIPENLAQAKKPDWLNDLSNYHNVGDMNNCWSQGACMRDGDFYGLDDLATEKPAVYQGLAAIYNDWIAKFGFVGFRVDTARHLDPEFFKHWSPLINQGATAAGISNFTIFGEVWEQSPVELMRYIRINKLQTALDFPFQRVAVDYAASSSDAATLSNLFEYDDYYTSPNSSPQNLVTFLGNHDLGRTAFLIETSRINPEQQLLARVKVAYALMYLSRGIPTVYYGDEVGMTGSDDGKDKLARQDMFKTQVGIWQSEKRVGAAPVGNSDSFADNANPISQFLVQLSQLRKDYPALANGQMQIRYSKGAIFAFSKRAVGDQREYIVALNNSAKPREVTISTSTNSDWTVLLGDSRWRRDGSNLTLTLPGFDTTVLRAKGQATVGKVEVGGLSGKLDELSGFYQLSAKVTTKNLMAAEFFVKNGNSWKTLGVDLNAPFRIYVNPEELNGKLEFKATLTDTKGKSYALKAISVDIPTP